MNDMRRLARAMLFLARGAYASVFENTGLAVLSLALAFSLWLFVTDRENPTEERAFNRDIEVTLVNAPNDLAVSATSASSVRVRVEGSQNELEDLRAEDFEATADLGGLERGTASVAVDVQPANSRVNIVGVTPARIDVTLEVRRSKDVPVRVTLVGSPQAGFVAGQQTVEPTAVTVSGAESLVQRVDAAVAQVFLTGQRVDLTEDRVKLEPRDARGGDISRVTVNPETASVTVDLEQREFTLEFTVTPLITGQPGGGYNVGGIAVEPAIVVISGPLDVLQSIDAIRGITTEEISVADARDDVTRTVEVIVPDGARVQGSTSVLVTIDIVPARGEFTFQISPLIRGVAAGLAATIADPVTVTLAGDVPALQALTSSSIAASIDASGLGPGAYALPVEVTPPAGTAVVRVEPGEAGVSLTVRP